MDLRGVRTKISKALLWSAPVIENTNPRPAAILQDKDEGGEEAAEMMANGHRVCLVMKIMSMTEGISLVREATEASDTMLMREMKRMVQVEKLSPILQSRVDIQH